MVVAGRANADLSGHAEEQHHSDHKRRRDAGNRRQVSASAEHAAERDREDRSHKGQERHQYEERRGRESVHGAAGGGFGSDVLALVKSVFVGSGFDAGGGELRELWRHGVDGGQLPVDRPRQV